MEKNENGEILLSGEVIGKIDGFLFTKADDVNEDVITDDVKTFVTQQLEKQIDLLINEGDAALRIEDDFTIRRQGVEIARLKKTDDILAPDFDIHVDPLIDGLPLARLALHIQSRIKRQINLALDPLEVVRKTEDLTDDGKAFVEKLISAMGYLPRQDVDNIVRAIQPEERSRLRKAGIRFAQYGVFVRDILKPMAQATKIILWALYNDFDKVPELPPAGIVSIPYNPDLPQGYYNIAGYRVCGEFVVRADMIEKLADSVRAVAEKTEENPKGEFEISAQHMSYVGKSGEVFTAILKTLGYDFRTETVTVVTAEVKPKSDDAEEKTSVEPTEEAVSQDHQAGESQEENAEKPEGKSEEDVVSDVSVTETEKEKQIWFWAGQKKKPASGNKKRFKKKESDGQNSDKKRGSRKDKFKGERKKSGKTSSKEEKSGNQPYVNMPGKHKVNQENNPFAALLNLKK